MKRPNKQDYNFLDSIDLRRFANDMIKWGDYVEKDNKELEKDSTEIFDELIKRTSQCLSLMDENKELKSRLDEAKESSGLALKAMNKLQRLAIWNN